MDYSSNITIVLVSFLQGRRLMFIPLNNRTHYSLLNALTKPKQLAQLKMPVGIADFNLFGSVEFYKTCKDENVKPLIGLNDGQCLFFARNYTGWKKLILMHNYIDVDIKDDIVCIWLPMKTDNDLVLPEYNPDFVGVTQDNTLFAREVANACGLRTVAVPQSHYFREEDATNHRILLCSKYKSCKLTELESRVNEDDGRFLYSNQYYLPSQQEVGELYSKDELGLTFEICAMCEEFNILNPPQIPEFCERPDEMLRQLCRNGWRNKIQSVISTDEQQIYVDRIKRELNVISEAKLANYFLIVQDFVNWTKNQGYLVGASRGSVGGCLVAYLLSITNVDPIKYGLLFERFYNAGRNTKERISLPDIDIDVPKHKRQFILDYIRSKYGEDRFANIITFSRFQGKRAIKDVLTARNACSFADMNDITKCIPDEAKIEDELQQLDHNSSILWALENNPKELEKWCSLKDGELKGELASCFKQAIELEGTKRHHSTHAAGIVISRDKIYETIPLVQESEDGSLLTGLEMNSCEDIGLVKIDVLSIVVLDKMMCMMDLLKNGGSNFNGK